MMTGMTIDAGTSLAPAYMLTLNSQDITSNFSDRLISLTMTDNRGFEADQLDIELDDTDGKVELPLRGAVMFIVVIRKISMGKVYFIRRPRIRIVSVAGAYHTILACKRRNSEEGQNGAYRKTDRKFHTVSAFHR